jgi:transcriptional regulator with XRE-family HTH domain
MPTDTDLMHDTFRSRLKEAMARTGVNANQMSVAMAKLGYHLPRQTIGNMLRGRTKMPRWDKLVLISGYLGVRPEWLADGVLPMEPAPFLDDSERKLVEAFRRMSPQHRGDLEDIAERWAEADGSPPDPSRPHLYDPRAPKQ